MICGISLSKNSIFGNKIAKGSSETTISIGPRYIYENKFSRFKVKYT
jgi:hypothetical protein